MNKDLAALTPVQEQADPSKEEQLKEMVGELIKKEKMDYLQAVRGEGVRDSLEKYRTDAEREKSGQAPVNFDFDLFV